MVPIDRLSKQRTLAPFAVRQGAGCSRSAAPFAEEANRLDIAKQLGACAGTADRMLLRTDRLGRKPKRSVIRFRKQHPIRAIRHLGG